MRLLSGGSRTVAGILGYWRSSPLLIVNSLILGDDSLLTVHNNTVSAMIIG